LQTDANTSGPPTTPEIKAAPSAGRLVLRVIVGGALLAVEDAGQAMQRLASSDLYDQVTPAAPRLPPSARHVLIGSLTVSSDWVNRRTNQLVRRGRAALSGGVKHVLRPLRFAARLPPNDGIRRWSSDVRARAAGLALNLGEVGRREERIARALARAVATRVMTSAVDRIANSPQLQSVIREQSAGMGRSALSDLRAQSARADAIAESLVGHLLPHSRRNNRGGSGSP
jgi:hypothetical protein